MRQAELLSALECPACRGGLALNVVTTPKLGRGTFGVLRCACTEYPVLDGIPIMLPGSVGMFEHTTGGASVEGLDRPALIRLILSGAGDEALVRCLAAPAMPLKLARISWRIANSGPVKRLAQWRGARRIRRLLANRDRITAREVLRTFYSAETPLGLEVGDYFALRFSQPRHLAALALAATLGPAESPLLDVACGVGHLAHYLTRRPTAVRVVGLDMNFHEVWLARHWVAPSGAYICANVADGLPIRTASMSAVIVSDAYHYFASRDAFNREVDRVAPVGPYILTRVGNAAVRPHEGTERTTEGYSSELGTAGVRVFSEQRLVRDYLRRRHPLAGPQEPSETLDAAKWLSFVVRGSAESPVPSGWPHAVGQLSINPCYAQTVDEARVRLDFRFPRTWYAYENHQMLEYHARTAELNAADLAALQAGTVTERLAALLDDFVIIGLPERY